MLNDTPLDETQQYHLKTINDCAQILLALINNLLDMSKVHNFFRTYIQITDPLQIEAGKMSLETCMLNPRDIVEEVCSLLIFSCNV